MRIVFAIHTLAHSGGTESYMTTVADQLQRAGHDVFIYSAEDGPTGETARGMGIRVVNSVREIPEATDVFLVQDGIAALELLDVRPEVPQVYNWHSELNDVQLPPQIEGVTRLIVTLHANAQRRIASLAVKPPVLRLTQPIDTKRFMSLQPLPNQPRKLLALSNYLRGDRREMLASACATAGIEFRQVGAHGDSVTETPELEINAADIVVGKARVALEAMACGRAVYVFDAFGGDGWITPSTYSEFEASCFAGNARRRHLNVEQLAAEFAEYDPSMGVANRDLVVEHHSAMRHAGELVEAIERVLDEPRVTPPNDNAFELARMARLKWRHEGTAVQLSEEIARLREELHAANTRMSAIEQSKRWRAATRLSRLAGRNRDV
ncbi:MAG: hypothetical protein ACRDKI_02460 [Solirubrobacterales bacterium]